MPANFSSVGEPKRRATYDDLVAIPDHLVAEILDGDLVTSPRPGARHAHATSVLGTEILGAFQRPPGDPERPGGWWILFEPELHLGPDVVVPDVAGWRRERLPAIPDVPWFDLPPDWLCETLSPSTAAIDRGRKLRIYTREGVARVWLLDPIARTLLAHDGNRWILEASHGGAARIRAVPFAAIEIELGRLWLD